MPGQQLNAVVNYVKRVIFLCDLGKIHRGSKFLLGDSFSDLKFVDYNLVLAWKRCICPSEMFVV